MSHASGSRSARRPAERVRRGLSILAVLAFALVAVPAAAVENGREERLAVARRVMEEASHCALVTIDDEGAPVIRTMGALPPDKAMRVRMVTNPLSRKVAHIRQRPKVVVYYFDPEAPAYVTITGTARLIDDKAELRRAWQEEWDPFYPEREDGALLIEVTPLELEVVSASEGILGDPNTWTPPKVRFVEP